jgi:hypothetical protein
MSTETTPGTSGGQAGTADGSPPLDDVKTQQPEGDVEGGEADSGASSEGDGGGEGPTTEQIERWKADAEAASGLREKAEALDTTERILQAHPELYRQVMDVLQGKDTSAGAGSRTEEVVSSVFQEAHQPGIRQFADALGADLEERILARVEERLGRRISSVERVASGAVFDRTLEQNGVPREVATTPAFQKHVRTMANDPDYKGLSASGLAKLAARTWSANARNRNQSDRARLDLAGRASAANGQPSARGSASAGGERDSINPKDIRSIYAAVKKYGTKDFKKHIKWDR